MGSLYERTEIYDLFDDEAKFEAIRKHWEAILKDREISSLLDVSIGTGSLTIPLVELGIELSGSDLSNAMLKRCKEKMESRGKSIALTQCDFRELTKNFHRTFDCVASTGNSLPYVSNEEVLHVLEQMDQLIRPGGYLYFDMRNWDRILRDRTRFYLYDPVFIEDRRVNFIQVWDYEQDGSMTFNLLYTFEEENKVIQKEQFEEHYIPISRKLMLDKLKEMHYENIEVLCHPAYFTDVNIDEVAWYCVVAKKGE